MIKPRLIAFYLPQFYPTPLNDSWWGPGYTEWRSVTQARPLFRGHYQPHEPADLGYYDLRLSEVREKQAEMARDAGIEGFMYWHYWMGNGQVLLDRPFKEVLESGKPDFPFCLGWANHNWTNKNWTKQKPSVKKKNLVEVIYSREDYIKHFEYVLPAFKDKRYMTVDGKPIFYIWDIHAFPDTKEFIDLWQDLARQNGLKGIFFVGLIWTLGKNVNEKGKHCFPSLQVASKFLEEAFNMNFDAVNTFNQKRAQYIYRGKIKFYFDKLLYHYFRYATLKKYDYRKLLPYLFVEEEKQENIWPTIMPNWDRSPRAGKDAHIYTHTTPQMFKKTLEKAIEIVKDKAPEHQIIIIKSWNEWGEGNHLEPDLKYGHGYLDVIKEVLQEK
jgi:hypothetical protein